MFSLDKYYFYTIFLNSKNNISLQLISMYTKTLNFFSCIEFHSCKKGLSTIFSQ